MVVVLFMSLVAVVVLAMVSLVLWSVTGGDGTPPAHALEALAWWIAAGIVSALWLVAVVVVALLGGL